MRNAVTLVWGALRLAPITSARPSLTFLEGERGSNLIDLSIDHFTWSLATAIYVAMVTPILYDNSYSLNDSNLKYESYRPYG